MSKEIGVSLEDFAEANIVSYKKGIEDSIGYLTRILETTDTDAMKKDIIKTLQEKGKIKSDW